MLRSAKKLLVSLALFGSFGLYILVHGRGAPSAAPGTSSQNPTVAEGTPPPGSLYKNGAFTGVSADAQWGFVQVQAIVKDGKLSDVKFLTYPNERDRSVFINTYAMPQLISESIQAQTAQVDLVSGATDTSEAFIQSLSDALTQAKA